MENLLISGNTNELVDWNVEQVLAPEPSKHYDRARMTDYGRDIKIARCGMTYLEIEQFNNTYNNFY
jgi:hypothetical protein